MKRLRLPADGSGSALAVNAGLYLITYLRALPVM
jgi:hypothetical protein